ncbi:ABC transporter substrate-binding protein [Dactylosporangium sp. NPDC051485]|uniref:ABC transporter substrate-binding protein n=1 Tax=Dactylosporangium sp. NPDC051485 TaxID=3154846 RepID=UPI00341C64DD
MVLRRARLSACLALLAATATLVAACGKSSDTTSQPGTSLTFTRLGINTAGFGPSNQSTGNDAVVNSLLFSNLVKVGPDEKSIIPDLAQTWEQSPDAKEFTFHLRQGVTWSDGQPFTAGDVVFTITQAAQFGPTAYVGYQPTQWRQVVGATEAKGTKNPVSGVTALDEHTVKMTLAAPNAEFIRNLTDAVYSIVPKHLLQDAAAENVRTVEFSKSKPVGTGPYVLEKAVPDQYLQFKANPKYFGGAPKIATLFFKLNVKPESVAAQLQYGELGMVLNAAANDAPALSAIKGLTTKFVVSPAAQFLQFRTDHAQAKDVRVRQAIYYAIDRRAMLKNLFGGNGEIRWVLPGFNQDDAALDRYDYNADKAKQLLAASGLDLGQPFKISYAQGVDPAWDQMMPAIQKYLKDVGLNAVLEPLDSAAWSAANASKDAKYPMTVNAGGSMGLSPDRSSGYFNCKAPLSSFYANCEMDGLYAQARGTTDASTRADSYKQVAQILNRDVPMVALWQTTTYNAWTSKLGGSFQVFPNDRDSAFNVNGWTLVG